MRIWTGYWRANSRKITRRWRAMGRSSRRAWRRSSSPASRRIGRRARRARRRYSRSWRTCVSKRILAAASVGLATLLPVPALSADDLDLGQPEPALNSVAWSGDLFVRQERLRSWYYGDNESRLWVRLRYGPTWQVNDQWSLGLAAKLHESTS